MEGCSGVGERGSEAAGDARRDDLVFEVHPEEGRFRSQVSREVQAGAGLIVPTQLGGEIDGGSGVVANDVLDPRRGEAAVEAGEKRQAVGYGVGLALIPL